MWYENDTEITLVGPLSHIPVIHGPEMCRLGRGVVMIETKHISEYNFLFMARGRIQ